MQKDVASAPPRRRLINSVMRSLPELPSLLFHQRLLLAVLAGSVATRDVPFGVALFLMIPIVARKETARGLWMLATSFLLGFGMTYLSLPKPPDCPSWASVPRKNVLVQGDIVSVTGLPGERLRVILENVHPVDIPRHLSTELTAKIRKDLDRTVPEELSGGRKGYPGRVFESSDAPLSGRVSMTLYASDLESSGQPIPGGKLSAVMRLYPSTGSVNPGTSDLGVYWADRDVWHNARLNRTGKGPLYLEMREGEGILWSLERLRFSWLTALKSALADDTEKRAAEGQGGKTNVWQGESSVPYSQGRAMLTALLFGDRSGLSARTVDLFTRAGLVHSLALSGQHLALAAMAGAAFAAVLALMSRRLFLYVPRRVLVVSAGVPFALCYLFLGGAPFSLIRAAFMMLAGAFFLCLRRIVAPLDALFAACLLLFIGWPLVAFDLSAQLSVLAVAGIFLSLPLISALRKRFPPPGRKEKNTIPLGRRAFRAAVRWTGTMLVLSLAAQLAVLPVLISVFGTVSLNFWMNLVWLPPLTFITLPGSALGLVLLVAFGPQPVSSLLFAVASWPADAMIDLLSAADQWGWIPLMQCFRPSSLSALGYGAVFAGLMMKLSSVLHGHDAGRAAGRLLMLGLLFIPAGQMPVWFDEFQALRARRVAMTVFDVGQGQSVLLEYPGGRMLVDGGGSSSPFFDYGRSILAPALTDRKLPRLDAVLVSHTDMDHARGLRWILEYFDVGCLYWSSYSAKDDSSDGKALRDIARRRGISEKILRRGDVLELAEGIRLEVVWPDEEILTSFRSKGNISGNEASLALRLTRDGKGLALLCGDMTTPALRRLAESGQALQSEVLVLPHHGATSSFQKKFYDAAAPDCVMASAASYNHYGFPGRKVREEMAKRNIPLYSTTMLGGMRVYWEGDGSQMKGPVTDAGTFH